ncbi:MAG: NAD(+) synthase [Coriobacteriales bacterium]|jgi:NAD+ synthase (glutamine-hydrolysing)|nr:NAD(+) synthase [Coriobacteriales bacterium]
MYIAVVQTNPKAGALKENAQKALALLDELAANPYPPDLVVFPAYALCGGPLEGLVASDAFAAECLDVARDFIARAALPTLIGSVVPRPLEDSYSFICEPEILYSKDGKGGALGFVDFENSWDYDKRASDVTIVLDGHTITVLQDDFPEPDDDFSDSEILILMLAKEYHNTNSMFTSSQQLNYLRSLAQDSNAWIVCVNLVGGQDATVFDGASLLLDNTGAVVEAAGPFVEQLFTHNIPLTDLDPSKAIPERIGRNADHSFIKPLLPYEADWRALTLAVSDYLGKNGFTDVVLGLSGGIDSAVTATLAVDALGPEHVHGVLMPGPYSSEGSISDATALAQNLGIETHTLPITLPFETFKSVSQEVLGQEGSALALQNLQARIRTIYLMHLSNTFNWLLLNTGNKSEAAMGFSTLYGDTAGAFAPLGNLYKDDVYGLAAWRNRQGQIIPPAILEKAPSAELYEGQTDQDSLPPYAELDRILHLHIEDGLGIDQIMEFARLESDAPLDINLVEEVLRSVARAEFKRRQEPLAPTLGYQDMCLDRNWPITNGFSDHSRNLSSQRDFGAYLSMIYSGEFPNGWDISAN